MKTLVNYLTTIHDSKNKYEYTVDVNVGPWNAECVVTFYEEPKLRFQEIDLSNMLTGVN